MSYDVLTVTLNPALDWTVSVPEFAMGEVNRIGSETLGAGGKGINVAAVLADYGLSVAATGFLGCDNEEPFRQLFARRGIQDRMVRLDGQTRVGIKIVDDSGGGTTDINFPGLTPSASDMQALIQEIEFSKAQWIVLAGSVPPGVDPAIYRDLAHRSRSLGYKVALDSSGLALRHALNAPKSHLPHLIKPNLTELEEWTGSKLESTSAILLAAQELVRCGVEQVAVSMGGEGMILVSCHEATHAIPPSVAVGSTVGAGDALVAGLIAAHISELNQSESAILATAFSVDVLTQPGNYGVSAKSITKWSRDVFVQPLQPVRGSPTKSPAQLQPSQERTTRISLAETPA